MTTSPAPLPRKRWWRSRWLWAFLVCLALCALIPVGTPFYLDWQINRDLAHAVAETDALDPGWRHEELRANRKAVPDVENAAQQVLKIGSFFPKNDYRPEFRDLRLPNWMMPGSSEHSFWRDRIDDSFSDLPDANQLNDQQIIVLESEWKQHRPAFEEARKLKDYRVCRFSSQDSKGRLSDYGAVRSAGRLLRFDGFRLCQANDLDGALNSVQARLVIAQYQQEFGEARDYFFQLAYLIEAANAMTRILNQGEPNPQRLAELQAAFEKEEAIPRFLEVVRLNRAEAWKHYVELAKAPAKEREDVLDMWRKLENKPPPPARPWYLAWLPKGTSDDLRPLQAEDLRAANRWVEFAKKPIASQAMEVDAFVKSQPFPRNSLLDDSCARSGYRVTTQFRTTRTAIALERYRQANKDWPATLDQLVPGYMTEVPTDLYTGKPLVYRKVDRGVIVYSVGPDRKDNGGKLRPEPNEIMGYPICEGFDFGVRLWDPAHRRQPALPPVEPRRPGEDGQ